MTTGTLSLLASAETLNLALITLLCCALAIRLIMKFAVIRTSETNSSNKTSETNCSNKTSETNLNQQSLENEKLYSSARIISFKSSEIRTLVTPKAQGWHSPLNISPIRRRSYDHVVEDDPDRHFFKDLAIENQFNQSRRQSKDSPKREQLLFPRKSPLASEHFSTIELIKRASALKS